MKIKVFSVFDVAAGIYQQPFFARSSGEAMRSFCDICGDVKHPLGQHPEDYTLFAVGYWDDKSGGILDEVNEKVITGVEAREISKGEVSDED